MGQGRSTRVSRNHGAGGDVLRPRLTFNLLNYRNRADGSEELFIRWNSTETYCRVDGQWRIIHSHWSFLKPV